MGCLPTVERPKMGDSFSDSGAILNGCSGLYLRSSSGAVIIRGMASSFVSARSIVEENRSGGKPRARKRILGIEWASSLGAASFFDDGWRPAKGLSPNLAQETTMELRKTDGYQVFLHLALLGLAALVVMLGLENAGLRSASAPSPSVGPAIGEMLRPINALDLEGRDVRLVFDGKERETMLLVLTTTCAACQANLPNWLELVERHDEGLDFVGLSLDTVEATRSYAEARDLPFEVFVAADPAAFKTRYEIAGVPETIHTGRDGRVRGAWLGVLPEDFARRGPLAADRAETRLGEVTGPPDHPGFP